MFISLYFYYSITFSTWCDFIAQYLMRCFMVLGSTDLLTYTNNWYQNLAYLVRSWLLVTQLRGQSSQRVADLNRTTSDDGRSNVV